jgi:cob(I)alamin adenosyltransferase
MKIYTKRGDGGETDLFGGERVIKNHLRVKAYGDIDCANSAIGMAYSTPGLSEELKTNLSTLMKLLFCAGAEVATSPKVKAQALLEKHLKNLINADHVAALEESIDRAEEKLVPLSHFILPCGSDAAARLHFARNMVRKAEISLIDLREKGDEVRQEIIQFFNRLSDLLFVLARMANYEANISDILWAGTLSS